MAQSLKFPGITAVNITALVDRFLTESAGEVSPTRLGIEAKNDPNTIFRIRNGSEPRQSTVDQIARAIERHAPGLIDRFLSEGATP